MIERIWSELTVDLVGGLSDVKCQDTTYDIVDLANMPISSLIQLCQFSETERAHHTTMHLSTQCFPASPAYIEERLFNAGLNLVIRSQQPLFAAEGSESSWPVHTNVCAMLTRNNRSGFYEEWRLAVCFESKDVFAVELQAVRSASEGDQTKTSIPDCAEALSGVKILHSSYMGLEIDYATVMQRLYLQASNIVRSFRS
ncbi:retrotransposon nucleocapsid related protein [Cyclospora cayetanensis]|uniref:Retrotransposon nucleocapsid related protein n=1 Tax=Cyclospora cayetanensis TaxID=88456 RepID=A0A1D3CTA8_9EIME|nr:retrotransposon nucleocapsid related protein [Cyclospora cayetanensis]